MKKRLFRKEWERCLGFFGQYEDPSPVVWDHTIAQSTSTFRGIYLFSDFKTGLSGAEADKRPLDLKMSLFKALPDRRGIDIIAALWPKENVLLTPLDIVPFYSKVAELKISGPASAGYSDEKIKEYLRRVDETKMMTCSSLIRIIIASTLRITYPTMIAGISRQLRLCLEDVVSRPQTPCYVLSLLKMGSNQWLTTLMTPLLREAIEKRVFLIVNLENLLRMFIGYPREDKDIIIIDDATYSGTQLGNAFELMLDTLPQYMDVKQLEGVKVRINFVLFGATTSGRNYITNVISKRQPNWTCHFWVEQLLPIISEIITSSRETLETISSLEELPSILGENKIH